MTNQLRVTNALIFLNVAVFLAMVGFTHGGAFMAPDIKTLQLFGANFGPLTMHGQYWRLITSMFVHIGLLHIGMNMWCLWALGRLAEPLFGSVKYLAIYFIAGLGGSLLSVFMHPMTTSAGASGAIFGIAGALVGLLLFRRDLFVPEARRSLLMNMFFFVFLNLAIGSAVPGIDMSCHVGGLLTGFVAGAAVSKFTK